MRANATTKGLLNYDAHLAMTRQRALASGGATSPTTRAIPKSEQRLGAKFRRKLKL